LVDNFKLKCEVKFAEVRGCKLVGILIEDEIVIGEGELYLCLIDDKIISKSGLFDILCELKHGRVDFFEKLGAEG
jgi:hypothetical protein